MFTTTALTVLVFCAVTYVKSETSYRGNYGTQEYVRIKRAKYYSNPPMRFYRRPPIPHPVKGIFSYTPPPNFMEDDSPRPGSFRPKQVSKRPQQSNDGLGDEDIHNLVQNLSKKDLDKIINVAGEKYRESPFEKYSSQQNNIVRETDDFHIDKPTVHEFDTSKRFSFNKPGGDSDSRQYSDSSQVIGSALTKTEFEPTQYTNPYNSENSGTQTLAQLNNPVQILYSNKPKNFKDSFKDISSLPVETQESMRNNHKFSFVESYIRQELNNEPTYQDERNNVDYVKVSQQERLPKPENLREDNDFEVSNTDNIPRIAPTNNYKIENFGNLPLMNYNSKLHTVSSYHVPHYSVISAQSQQQSKSSQLLPSPSAQHIKVPKIEPAPHHSAAKEQSDAHLKAIKIWTHQSTGTAYTLHDDGTLSLERDRGQQKEAHRK